MNRDWGRHLYGASSIAFGIIGIVWHDFDEWLQLRSLWNEPYGAVFVYVAAVTLIVGGLALQFAKTIKIGAWMLGAAYAFFAVRWIPHIIAQPQAYDNTGNFFERPDPRNWRSSGEPALAYASYLLRSNRPCT